MKNSAALPIFTLLISMLLHAWGCSGDAEQTDQPADTGVSGTEDAGEPIDATVELDGGQPPLPSDGLACRSSFTSTSTFFARDDCEVGQLCIPWGMLAQDQRLTGPVQSCVRPCTVDADCGQNSDGSNRYCVNAGFTRESGAERICVDALAEPDRYCGYSRLTTSQIPGVAIRTPGGMVGCRPGMDCIQRFFNDVHVDEGVCTKLCTDSSDCIGTGLPHCNPAAVQEPFNGVPVDVGICSDRVRGIGALCGTDDPSSTGYSTRCDTSNQTPPGTMCVPGQLNTLGLELPEGLGVCGTVCNAERPCGSDPALGPMTCSDLFLTLAGESIGLCGSDCSNFPESCLGPGGRGAGRFCGPAAAAGAQFCIDVEPPTLQPGEIVNGVRNEAVGDNCLSGANVLSCPQGSTCISNTEGTRGWCYFGCSLTAVNGDDVCRGLLGVTQAACEQVLATAPGAGLCSETR